MATTRDALIRLLDIGLFLAVRIDHAIATARAFDRSCRETGFLMITCHVVPDRPIRNAFDELHGFFQLPTSDNVQSRSARRDNLGTSNWDRSDVRKARLLRFAPDFHLLCKNCQRRCGMACG